MKLRMWRRREMAAGGSALLVLLALAVVPAAGGQGGVIFWQGQTPPDYAGFAVTVGQTLEIPLDAVGPSGSNVTIDVTPRPRGAVLDQTSTAPARAVLRWTPTVAQAGDYILYVSAYAGRASAPELTVYVHVSREPGGPRFGLSSLTGRSRNATLVRSVAAYASPRPSARVVARLRAVTPEQVPHVVYLVEGRIDPESKRYWIRIRLPTLPNGSTGWIPREAVEEFRSVDTHVVINRARFRISLLKRGRPIFSSIVGVGMSRWPTPAGIFYIRERLTGFTDPIYGRLAFGTNGRSPVLTDWPGGGFIGIHGTNQPQILPGRVSHGCVRMRNADIRRLDRLMPIGTPVTIR